MTNLESIGSYTFCGTAGGLMQVMVAHPARRVVLRVNAIIKGREYPYETLLWKGIDTTRQIIQGRGLIGLYKGLGTCMMLGVPRYTMYFTGYGCGLAIFGSSDPNFKHKYREIYCAGCFSAFIAAPIVMPSDRLREVIEWYREDSKRMYTGSSVCTMSILRSMSFRTLYKGFFPTLIRDIPSTGAFFLAYEYFTDYMNLERGDVPSEWISLFAGCVAGAVYLITSIPFDKARSKYQDAPKGTYKRITGTSEILKELYRDKGFAGLFRGSFPRLFVTIPSDGACFLGFNLSSQFLDYMKDKKKNK